MRRGSKVNPGQSLWPSCCVPTFLPPLGSSSLVLSSQLPLRQDWPSFPFLPTSCGLPGFLLAHLQLPGSRKGTSCAHPSLIWVFHPVLSLPPPPAPLATSGHFPPAEPVLESPALPLPTPSGLCTALPAPSQSRPLGVLLFLKRSSCAFCWPTQLFLSLTTEVMSFVTINRKRE